MQKVQVEKNTNWSTTTSQTHLFHHLPSRKKWINETHRKGRRRSRRRCRIPSQRQQRNIHRRSRTTPLARRHRRTKKEHRPANSYWYDQPKQSAVRKKNAILKREIPQKETSKVFKQQCRYFFTFTVYRPTIQNVAEYYYVEDSKAISNIRWDAFALFLHLTSTSPSMLVFEKSKGLLPCSLILRGAGTVTVVTEEVKQHSKIINQQLNLKKYSGVYSDSRTTK